MFLLPLRLMAFSAVAAAGSAAGFYISVAVVKK
jgi:hypothetical protein